MGVLYGIGQTLVSREELIEKAAIGRLRDFADAFSAGKVRSIDFTSGAVSTKDLPANQPDALPFEPVALNKPLTLEMVSAYTGDAPGRSFFDRIVGRSKPDLLIVSGVKTPTTFGAAPRAINQIVKDIDDKERYRPGALREGSSIIYHAPAVVEATTYVSVEMVVDSFSGEVFNHLESLFRTAAGLPVFAPAATYLLAGSVLTRIGKKLAEALTESGPFLKADEDIQLDSAGFPIELARFLIFAADSDLPKLAGYSPRVIEEAGNARVTLVDKQGGREYAGDVPYVIASLDGRPRPTYKDFAPQHASAAMLQQFYGRDTLAGITEALKDSLTLYNDLRFRRSAERVKTQLEGVEEGSAEYKKLKARLDAYVVNIQTDELKEGL